MAGYSVKRNEILHLDSYNKTTANDKTIPLLKQIFLDLVGDGTDTYPNHGFKDVSPFITRVEIDDEVLTKGIIDNYFKKFYKWAEAGRIGTPNQVTKVITYDEPKWKNEGVEDPLQRYPEMEAGHLVVSKKEMPATPGMKKWYPLSRPKAPYARWMKYDSEGDMIEVAESDPEGFWAMPVIAYKPSGNDTDPEVEFVADTDVFRKEVMKVVNIITNANRNNTMSTNGSTPQVGDIRQYKYDTDVVTGKNVHSFWIMTNKDTPLFQAESDKCLDATDGSDITSTYGTKATCEDAGNTWQSGNVIPLEHEIVIDVPEDLNPGYGHRYTVTLAVDPSIINPGSEKPYEDKVFQFDFVQGIDATDLTNESIFKKNLFMAFKKQSMSSEYIMTLEDDVLKVKDTETGRPFTISIVDEGRLTDSAPTSFVNSNARYLNSGNDPSSSYLWASKLLLAQTEESAGTYPIGNEYTYTITIPENAGGPDGTGIPIPAFNFEWSYVITNPNETESSVLSKLVTAINEHDDNKVTYFKASGEVTVPLIKASVANNNILVLDSGVSELKMYPLGGELVSSIGTNYYYYRNPRNAKGDVIGTFTSTVNAVTAEAGNVDFSIVNTVIQQAQEGSNNDISFNFHLWKDMFFAPDKRYLRSKVIMDEMASWDVQPMMSIDCPFSRVIEIKDHSMGPIVLETLPSSSNGLQLSGKFIPDTTKEKPQAWRIRFDVNRGVELRDQATNIQSISDRTYPYEYLEVNVATEHQLLSNGRVTQLEGRDGMKAPLIKTPGYLGFIREQIVGFSSDNYESVLGTSAEMLDETDYIFERARIQKGFFRRSTKSTVENSYPMSYRLTVAPHGIFFHLADDASADQSDDYAWFVVQRHVEVGTGTVYTQQTAPLHCVYMSSEPPTYLSDLDSYYINNPYEISNPKRIEELFDQNGYTNLADISVAKNHEIGMPDIRNEGRFRRFIVREKNVLKPWDVHKFASINTVDSHAILNTQEQLSMTDRNKLTITFPNRLTSQSFVFTGQELDMIAYCDAGVIAESTFISSSRYNDNRVYEALRSTRANGNGMRILALCYGDMIEDSDVIPEEVLSSV